MGDNSGFEHEGEIGFSRCPGGELLQFNKGVASFATEGYLQFVAPRRQRRYL